MNKYIHGNDRDDEFHSMGGNNTILGGHGNDFTKVDLDDVLVDCGEGCDIIKPSTVNHINCE